MSLFDPPAVGIRRRCPTNAHALFDQLEAQVASAVPARLDRTQHGLVVGFVMASWALSEHRRGAVVLDPTSGGYISNMGTNCARLLKDEDETALSMVRHLVAKGVIVEAA